MEGDQNISERNAMASYMQYRQGDETPEQTFQRLSTANSIAFHAENAAFANILRRRASVAAVPPIASEAPSRQVDGLQFIRQFSFIPRIEVVERPRLEEQQPVASIPAVPSSTASETPTGRPLQFIRQFSSTPRDRVGQ